MESGKDSGRGILEKLINGLKNKIILPFGEITLKLTSERIRIYKSKTRPPTN